MRYLIEARYINHQPCLSIVDAESRRPLLQWELHQVQALIENGDIPEGQFLQPEKYGMKLLLKHLFLLACMTELKAEAAAENGRLNPYLHYRLGSKSEFGGGIGE